MPLTLDSSAVTRGAGEWAGICSRACFNFCDARSEFGDDVLVRRGHRAARLRFELGKPVVDAVVHDIAREHEAEIPQTADSGGTDNRAADGGRKHGVKLLCRGCDAVDDEVDADGADASAASDVAVGVTSSAGKSIVVAGRRGCGDGSMALNPSQCHRLPLRTPLSVPDVGAVDTAIVWRLGVTDKIKQRSFVGPLRHKDLRRSCPHERLCYLRRKTKMFTFQNINKT